MCLSVSRLRLKPQIRILITTKQDAHTHTHIEEQNIDKVSTHLRVNTQRPSPCICHDDSILNGEAVIGQTGDLPLPDLDWVTQGCCQREFGVVGDAGDPGE